MPRAGPPQGGEGRSEGPAVATGTPKIMLLSQGYHRPGGLSKVTEQVGQHSSPQTTPSLASSASEGLALDLALER